MRRSNNKSSPSRFLAVDGLLRVQYEMYTKHSSNHPLHTLHTLHTCIYLLMIKCLHSIVLYTVYIAALSMTPAVVIASYSSACFALWSHCICIDFAIWRTVFYIEHTVVFQLKIGNINFLVHSIHIYASGTHWKKTKINTWTFWVATFVDTHTHTVPLTTASIFIVGCEYTTVKKWEKKSNCNDNYVSYYLTFSANFKLMSRS